MGIRDILQNLHQKAEVLWELVLPRKHINGNMNTFDTSLCTEVTAPNEGSSSIRSTRVTAESLPTLRYYARSQLRVGRQIANGGQAVIYEARMSSTSSIRPVPVVVKKFKAIKGVVQGLFPLEFVTYKYMYVCQPAGFFFDNDGSLCMIMDRYSGDLRDLIDSEKKFRHDNGPPFTEPIAVSIIVQLALGLRSLHISRIWHKDLKCSNILVQRNLKEILFPSGALDMDFAVAISDFESSDDVKGTGFWRAPEVLQCLKENVSLSGIEWQKADVYSFGMTCYEILTGRSPFHDHPWTDYNVVLSGGRPELPSHVSGRLKDIVKRCWNHDPNDRPTFAEIIPLLKQIDECKELWDVGFSKVESVICWESSLGILDAVLLELVRLVVTETAIHKLERHGKNASQFVVTVREFVSRYGRRSYVTHPSKPFVEFVDRERLYTLLTLQYSEEFDIYAAFVHRDDAAFDRNARIIRLMQQVYFTVIDGAWRSIYSKQAHGESLTLGEKLSVIEKVFVEPLLDGGANKLLIFKAAKRLLHEESSKEDQQKEIEKFQLRFMISISLLLIPDILLCVVGLQDIVRSPGVLEFLTEHMSSFPSICFLLRQLFTEHDGRLSHFLKVFLDLLAIDLFLPVITIFLQLKLLGWRGLLSWWLVAGIFKSLFLATWRSRGQSLQSSKLVSHRICYLAICCLLEIHWIHYLALTMK